MAKKRRSRTTSRQPERDVFTSSRRYAPRAPATEFYDDFLPSGYLPFPDRTRVSRYDPTHEQMEDDLRFWTPSSVSRLPAPPRYRGTLTPARVVVGKPSVQTRRTRAKAPGSPLAAFWSPPVLTPQLRWAEPLRLSLCRRRTIRSQVLHALGLTGKGSGGRGHRNFFSSIAC